MVYSVVKQSERVRTTITLPSDLLQRSQRFIDDGTVASRPALIKAALEHMLDELEHHKIHQQFAAMADDHEYLSLNEATTDEFAASDWEALQVAEGQDKA